MMVYNSTNISKINNFLSPQIIDHKKTTTYVNLIYFSQDIKICFVPETSILKKKDNTVRSAYVVTSIKQSPVLTDHLILVLSSKISHELNPVF